MLAADRAYTDQIAEHFAQPVRALGYQLVLGYKQQHRGVQGIHQGALLVDGSLACPAMPDALARATAGLDDRAVRGIDDSGELRDLIAACEPYFLRLEESADQRGAIQAPVSGQRALARCVVSALQPGPPSPGAATGRGGPRQQAVHRRTRCGWLRWCEMRTIDAEFGQQMLIKQVENVAGFQEQLVGVTGCEVG